MLTRGVMATTTRTAMSIEPEALYRLMSWLSPAYPVGAFSHSHGLEWAVGVGEVAAAEELGAWIEDILYHGSGRQDAIMLVAAHRAATMQAWQQLKEISELALALNPSRERHVETLSQGRAFMRATERAWPFPAAEGVSLPELHDVAYPVAVGMAAGYHDIQCTLVLTAYLHAFTSNLVSAGVRLIPLGQSDGQALIARLEPTVHDIAERAPAWGIEDLGNAVFLADIGSMRHETQYTRLFRT